jgi:hypothetical protein
MKRAAVATHRNDDGGWVFPRAPAVKRAGPRPDERDTTLDHTPLELARLLLATIRQDRPRDPVGQTEGEIVRYLDRALAALDDAVRLENDGPD